MPEYIYEARDKEEKKVKGLIAADSVEGLRARLEEMGYVAKSIKEHKRRRKPGEEWAERKLAELFPESDFEARCEPKLIEAINQFLKKLFFREAVWLLVLFGFGMISGAILFMLAISRGSTPVRIAATILFGLAVLRSLLSGAGLPIRATLARIARTGLLQELILTGVSSSDLFWILWRDRFKRMLIGLKAGVLPSNLIVVTLLLSAVFLIPTEIMNRYHALAVFLAFVSLVIHGEAYTVFRFLNSINEELRPRTMQRGWIGGMPWFVRTFFENSAHCLLHVLIILLGINLGLYFREEPLWLVASLLVLIAGIPVDYWQIRRVYREFKSNYAAWFDEKITEVIESSNSEAGR